MSMGGGTFYSFLLSHPPKDRAVAPHTQCEITKQPLGETQETAKQMDIDRRPIASRTQSQLQRTKRPQECPPNSLRIISEIFDGVHNNTNVFWFYPIYPHARRADKEGHSGEGAGGPSCHWSDHTHFLGNDLFHSTFFVKANLKPEAAQQALRQAVWFSY